MKNRILTFSARAVSTVLHPFVLPMLVLTVLLWGDTAFAIYPPRFKFYLCWVVALYTLVIPGLWVALLRRTGHVTSWSIEERSERALPLMVSALCCIACAMTVGRIASAEIIRRIMLAEACCQMMCLAVNYFWKISLHMTAIGGCTALMAMLCILTGGMTPLLAATVVAAGALASSRLFLGQHELRQVAAGFAGGFAVMSLAMLLL